MTYVNSVLIGVGTALEYSLWGYLKGKAAKSSGTSGKMPSERKKIILQKKSS